MRDLIWEYGGQRASEARGLRHQGEERLLKTKLQPERSGEMGLSAP